jgi:hypothetical protein
MKKILIRGKNKAYALVDLGTFDTVESASIAYENQRQKEIEKRTKISIFSTIK